MDATRVWRLEGVIRDYAWGSRTAIPELLGVAPTGAPQAELWLGAHPSAPSLLVSEDGERAPLDAFVARDPDSVLGRDVAARFGGELPFLLKLLAADAPLSIQAHPDARQAREGFAREDAAGVPRDALHRCYRDPYPKPELVCALTSFRALNRFRGADEVLRRIGALGVSGLDEVVAPLLDAPNRDGLDAFFRAWMTRERATRERLVARVAEAADVRADRDPACAEVVRLANAYPGDPGVLAPLFLNLVALAPGEAMFLPAGELHAYLGGLAVEVMGSSDNVLRGGLTPKHVDVPELLRTLTFESGPVDVLTAAPAADGVARYETPAEAFALARVGTRPNRPFVAAAERSVEIWLCVEGRGRLVTREGLDFGRGDAWLVPAAAPTYRIEGEARLFRVGAGLREG